MTLSAGCYGLGYLTGLAAFAWLARRRKLATAGIMTVMGAGLLGGLVGANLAQWVFGGVTGKTVLGGIAGGYLCVVLYKRHLDVSRYLDLFTDRMSFSGLVGGAARWVWSDVAHLRGRQTLRDLGVLFARGGLRAVVPLMRDPEAFGRRVFRVVVKPFMDAHTYDKSRIDQCCTKILTADGSAVSFCEFNVFHRGRKSRAAVVPLKMLG